MNTPTVQLRVLCFACFAGAGRSYQPGHYLRTPNGGGLLSSTETPWGLQIDGGLCGGDKYALPDGKTYEHHKDGWTAVAFWDRSGDERPASNTVFVVQAEATTEQILEAARAQWPQLFARPNFPLTDHHTPMTTQPTSEHDSHMNTTGTLTVAAKELHELRAKLATHNEAAKREADRLEYEIRKRREVLSLSGAGIDFEKVALAETVIYATDYKHGGAERASCVEDAINQLSTGGAKYSSLWTSYFGTKNYDRWSGQRSDHTYGYGPSHGSICFEIGLTQSVRERKKLTPEETEAAIYFLLNLERIQSAKTEARQ